MRESKLNNHNCWRENSLDSCDTIPVMSTLSQLHAGLYIIVLEFRALPGPRCTSHISLLLFAGLERSYDAVTNHWLTQYTWATWVT